MSLSRFYESKPVPVEENHLDDFLKTMDAYIEERQRVNPQSHGIARAKSLKNKLAVTFVKVEQLTDLQLQWRIYDYICMEKGAGPLATSKVLRAALLTALCKQLNITNKLIKEAKKKLHDEHLQIMSSCALPPGFFRQDEKIIGEKAIHFLIRERLLQASERNANKVENKCLTLLRVGLMKCQAKDLERIIENQWIAVEKLNDYQIMCRLYEHIMISMQVSHGLLGNYEKLRWTLAHAICEFLQLDERVIRRDEYKVLDHPVYIASPFGPIYQHHDPGRITLGVRMEHIEKALFCRGTAKYSAASNDAGDDIELKRMTCNKV